jgi:RHS repeat-associated protein
VGFGTTGSPATYASTITTTFDAGDRATTLVDSVAGTISRTFDLLDRLTEEETPEGTVDYTYDDAGRRSSMTVAGQTAVSYAYDNADRLTGITQGSASVAFTYDAANRRTSLTLPNGIVIESAYDDDSQLTGLTYKLSGSTIGDLTYGYDASGRRVSMGGSYARTNLPAALNSATYDDANQIASWAGTSFTYDDNGSLTSDGAKSYSWNARNELSGISGGVSASFAYDAVGRRRSRSVASTTTQFLYDGLNPVQELASGTPTANLLTGLRIDEYLVRTDSAGARYLLTDALGSTIALADGSGSVQTEYSYEPFGSVTTSGSSSANTFGFTGRENDGTGLSFYRARYYDARLQRFVGEDPIAFDAGDPNLYSYVRSAPIQLRDPSGEVAIGVVIIGIGAGYGAVTEGIHAYATGGNVGTAIWQGAVAGAIGAGAGIAGAWTGGPMAAGASSSAAYSVAIGYFNGNVSLRSVGANAAFGAAMGPLARALTPKVPGRFPLLFRGRPFADLSKPKAQQLFRESGLGGIFNYIGAVLGEMFGRGCGDS